MSHYGLSWGVCYGVLAIAACTVFQFSSHLIFLNLAVMVLSFSLLFLSLSLFSLFPSLFFTQTKAGWQGDWCVGGRVSIPSLLPV